jgi:hypothetical protein
MGAHLPYEPLLHDQDYDMAIGKYFCGLAAEKEAFDPTPTVGCHDDQLATQVHCRFQNCRRRMCVGNMRRIGSNPHLFGPGFRR